MSKLVPEKRVDKNGRLTTRHVRADNASTITHPSIPAPAVQDEMDSPRGKDGLGQSISSLLVPNYPTYEKAAVGVAFSRSLRLSTLRHIHSWANSLPSGSASEAERHVAFSALSHLITRTNPDDKKLLDRLSVLLAETASTIAAFNPYMSMKSAGYVTEVVRGVNYSAKVNRFASNALKLTEDDRRILRYSTFEYMVQKVGYSRPIEWLQEESQWFDENAEKLALHADSLLRRGTIDRDYLDELLKEGTSLSLSQGVL